MLNSPTEEMVRLIMLLYLTKMVRIPGRNIPYGWMGKQVWITYERVAEGPFEEDKALCLWALMVAAATIATSQTEWLRSSWDRVAAGLDWLTIKQHAASVMWIDALFDQVAEKAYHSLSTIASV
jgi:hypothetical protein